MALVGRDARVNGWRDQSAHFGRRDEERLRPRTPFRLGRFAIYVATELRPAVLEYEKERQTICKGSICFSLNELRAYSRFMVGKESGEKENMSGLDFKG